MCLWRIRMIQPYYTISSADEQLIKLMKAYLVKTLIFSNSDPSAMWELSSKLTLQGARNTTLWSGESIINMNVQCYIYIIAEQRASVRKVRPMITSHSRFCYVYIYIYMYVCMSAPGTSRHYSCTSLMAAPCAGVKRQWDNLVSPPSLYLGYCLAIALSIVSFFCYGNGRLSLEGYIFCVPAGRYPAFVQLESSECESADDTYGCWTARHCTSAQQSREGSTSATAKADRLSAVEQQRKPVKNVLRSCRATILFCITHLHARHVLCVMCMPSTL